MNAVSYKLHDGVARIRLCEPARGNALNQNMVSALARAVRRARADGVHVVVLSAEGKTFSVGGDLAAMQASADPEQMIDDLAEALHRVVSDLHRMDAIVISAVHGVAAGAGVPLALAADLVLAGTSARFTLAYTKVGLSPDGGSSLLTSSVGLHRALQIALLNPFLSAQEAQQIGLVAQVHPDENLETALEAVVDQLRSGSRSAQVAAKRLMREAATPRAEGSLRRETLAIRECAASLDGREGVAAFLEGRPPNFRTATSELPESSEEEQQPA